MRRRRSNEFRVGSRRKALLFFALLYFLMVLSLILPLRPTESQQEKRQLTAFPKLTASAFFSGEFFRGVDDWFADTFPGRDFFLSLNQKITSLYGIQTVAVHGELQQGDDIPDAPFTG